MLYTAKDMLLSSFFNVIQDKSEHTVEHLGFKQDTTLSLVDVVKYLSNQETFFEDMHPNWILNAIKHRHQKDIKFIIGCLPEKYLSQIEKSKILLPKLKAPEQKFASFILNSFLIHYIKAPFNLVGSGGSKEEYLKAVLTVPQHKIQDLIYALGLKDIANSLTSLIDAKKKVKILQNINPKFKNIFIAHARERDRVASPSVTFDQLSKYIDSGQGIDATIYSYGMTRLALSLMAASLKIKSAFYKKAGPTISKELESIISNSSSKNTKYFIKSLLNAIFYITGGNFDQ